jgi:tRNA U34 2-thiouridine synthase MnmA/TrmU
MKKPKILILFSGGLDSRLAVKILEQQGDIECINFILPFGSGCCNTHCSLNFSQKENINLKIVDCTKGRLLEEYLNIVRKPKFGRGTCMNPCIDCRIFLLKKAKDYADKNKIKIIATGEVLGERPMSQHKKALELIDKETKLEGKLLRPLSAKLLEETDAEKSGLIDRSKLFDIQGRSRKRQIELAEKYNISYPSPAGGCLLCEPEFCKRLKPVLSSINEADIELLRFGRHFPEGIILGRNEQENQKLEKIAKKNKLILVIPNQPGPSALIKDKKLINKAKELIKKYSKNKIDNFEIIN